MRPRPTLATALLFLLGAIAADPPATAAADDAAVPGGPAAIRRLLSLDPSRPPETFFLDLHETLLAGAEWNASWSQVERRRAVVDFTDDLADFRKRFGRDATLSLSGSSLRRTRAVLDWLGVEIENRGETLVSEARDEARSVRRRAALDAIGFPISSLLAKLKLGESVRISSSDGVAPIPFGLAAWRELLDEPRLAASEVFLDLVKDVTASRLLVTLHALDPETREGLRAIARAGKGAVLRDRDVLDRLARFPGALALSGGEFLLPGGREAQPIWTDLFGVSPSQPSAFLRALFEKDGGRGAYVVEVLQQLPEPVARAFLFGAAGTGPTGLHPPQSTAGTGPAGQHPPQSITGTGASQSDAIARMRKLYRAIEEMRRAIDISRRDPYDFAHLARFLRVGPSGELALLPLALDGEAFPKGEAELGEIVTRSRSHAEAPEDTLARLIRGDTGGARNAPRAIRKFLLVSSLLDGRPALEDPGVVALLLRGSERFGPAYALLEDEPFQDPVLAKRYLFRLDRLERREPTRETEVAVALFQAGAELLALSYRAGSLDVQETRALFSSFLDLTLFARGGDLSPARGEQDLFAWVSTKFVPALDAGHRAAPPEGAVSPQADEPETGEDGEVVDENSPDERLSRALTGRPPPAVFEWGGGHYRFDPAADEVLRKRRFREKQRLASLEDLEEIHRGRDALVAAARRGDAPATRAASADLADRLEISEESGESGGSVDERVREEFERAREALEQLGKVSRPAAPSAVERDLAPVDAAIAERLLEALLGHVYSVAAGDPEDLYYEDPDFVRRHSFRTVVKGGRIVESAFSPTMLTSESTGGGSRVSGSLFGLADVLGLLHVDQITYAPGASITNENIRSGLVGPVRRVSAARLDDDALRFVAASCRATEELAATLAARERAERFQVWRELAKDLVPRSRLALLAELRPQDLAAGSLSRTLSPSDLYRIGRRIARGDLPAAVPAPDSAATAKEALERLVERHGPAGARDRLAEFGPRAVAWAGRARLTDMDLPAYESLAAYRAPQLFADRLYDWKVAVARAVADAGLPAQILPLVLPRAVDEMMSDLKMAFPYDWNAIVRRSSTFGAADVTRLLDEGLQAGRLHRDHARDAEGETR